MNSLYHLVRKERLKILPLLIYSCGIMLTGCQQEQPVQAKNVIIWAQKVHGSQVLDRARVTFDFRGKQFEILRFDGQYQYKRQYQDSTGMFEEYLTNEGVSRIRNGKPQTLSDDEKAQIETALNSVVYFALLPYNLKDEAVQAKYLGTAQVEGQPYHQIEVRFTKQAGGKDWQDRYIYWFHQKRGTMDYLAYFYHTNESGARFRKAINPKIISGVRIADYLNYRAPENVTSVVHENLLSFPQRFENGELSLLSEVDLEQVTITPLTQSWQATTAKH